MRSLLDGRGVLAGLAVEDEGIEHSKSVLGLILGQIGEQNFAQGMQMVHYDLWTYFSRPICAILIVAGVLTLGSSIYRAFAPGTKSV